MTAYQRPPVLPSPISAEPTGPEAAGDWMSELGLAYEEAGDGLVRGGHPLEATEKYEAALSIFERLAGKNPSNTFAASHLQQLKAKIS